ncbi:phage tail length tape measure family protein [Pluralibacter gergoviae]|uniref:phage tail tape measure protein n=1 Tax=Pluralibacter gergoviae TaxID=61647 RepID=UPI00190B4FF2|nr:phage tail length tape measure family protein [Pluralibacter gergoviae]MBK4118812.1 phage tail length tape measure family protein [Pluralibacter gergoviae]
MAEKAGEIYYTVDIETANALEAVKQINQALGTLDSSARTSVKGLDNLDKSADQTGAAFSELAGYARSMDGSLKNLNSNVNSITRAMQEAGSSAGGAGAEFTRAEAILESLGNQLAILEEAQENGARSAAMLTAQIRAGSKATDEEKQKIGELTGRLYDMKTGVDTGAKSHGNWKTSMQQAGYQVQDFVVQVQGGQSALVAFAQQGSQLAGAFGPGGAVLGAVIAIGSAVAGTLVASLGKGKDAMEALQDATKTLDDVMTVSSNGVAALSDKYAEMARINLSVATAMKKQAELEVSNALAKLPSQIQDVTGKFITLTDRIKSGFSGASPSIKLFNANLKFLGVTTDDYGKAMGQAMSKGPEFQTIALSMADTIDAIANRFAWSSDNAFKFTKMLSDVSNKAKPTTDDLMALNKMLQDTHNDTQKGREQAAEYAKGILEIASSAVNAESKLAQLRAITISLGDSQAKALQQARQELFITKQTGAAKQQAQAWRDAERQGLKSGTQAFREYYQVRLQTYKQQEANAEAAKNDRDAQSSANSAARQAGTQAERNARILEDYHQKASLSADSTSDLSREQAILAATQKLTNPTPQQVAQVQQDAAAAWDKAAALKAQNAVPERKENADYAAQRKALDSLKDQKNANGELIISQEQYNRASEQLEEQHQVNLAKIRAQQVVSPTQQAQGEVDPVQQLANQHAQEIALIQQFETQKGQLTQRGIELMNAANKQYEQQRIAAQWEIYRNQSLGNEALAASFDALAGNASNALTGVITGSMSAQEAMRSLASTVLNSLVNSFVQMGVEWAKSAIMGAAKQEAAIGATTAAQVAGIGVQTAASTTAAVATTAAWTPAAIMSSIASFGGAVAIGMGAMAGIMALSKGRKNGGPVTSGNVYPVGEGNLPEFMQTNKGLFMIPGDKGRVFSNKDVTGGTPSIKKASTGKEYLNNSGSNSSQQSGSSNRPLQVNIQFFDQTSGGSHTLQTETSMDNGIAEVRAYLLDDQANNGEITRGYAAALGTRVVARGAF